MERDAGSQMSEEGTPMTSNKDKKKATIVYKTKVGREELAQKLEFESETTPELGSVEMFTGESDRLTCRSTGRPKSRFLSTLVVKLGVCCIRSYFRL
jgi:hypothetical protein